MSNNPALQKRIDGLNRYKQIFKVPEDGDNEVVIAANDLAHCILEHAPASADIGCLIAAIDSIDHALGKAWQAEALGSIQEANESRKRARTDNDNSDSE
jgi:hypothetical protein